jgi:VWFA-related protein
MGKEVKGVKEVKTSRGSRRLGIVLFVLFTSLTLFTSLPGAAQQSQAPTFRSKVEIIQLDVSVLDKHRQPVRDLTEKDFTILEDGKPQRIVGFSTFDVDDAAPPATGWMRDVPPDITTNDLKPESRLFVIVLDDAMIPQDPSSTKSSKEIAKSIIDKLSPEDLTAIVFTGDNRKTQDFTKDKTKLLAALDKFNPGLAGYRFGSDRPPCPPPPMVCPTPVDTDLSFYQSAVRTLGNIADYLIAAPNRRKAVFWVSPGVPMDLIDCWPSATPSSTPVECGGTSAKLALPSPIWTDMMHRLDDIFRAAQRANVTVYPIDPVGIGGMNAYLSLRLGADNRLVAEHKAIMQRDFLAMTAANTGGRTVMNTNAFEPGITEIFEENKSYYLVAFEPTNAKEDGTLRKIQVIVNRPDVDVRTRSSYYAPQPEKPDKKLAAMTPEGAALAKAMSGMLPNAGMPMRASAAAFAVPGQRLATVTVVLGVRQPVPASAANGRVTETTELLTSAFTPEGDARGTQRHTAKVQIRKGADGEAAYEVLSRIDLPAGRYQLRLAAHSSSAGKDGSVFVDVIVPDYSNIPFSASPAVLSATPGRVSAPKDLFTPLLPIVPTAEREFAPTDRVKAFIRLYQSGQKPVEKVQLAIRIRDAADEIKVSETQIITVDQFTAAGQQVTDATPAQSSIRTGRSGSSLTPTGTPATQSADKFANLSLRTADVNYAIPFQKLTLGPHLLTFEATLGATTIRRDIRFEVK